jgi:flagellar protein FliS
MTATTYGRGPAANRYHADSLATASPAALLVMLYDRLVLDLGRAEKALGDGDRESAHHNLVHAQDIVSELVASLEDGVWNGSEGLKGLYGWVLRELAVANVKGDQDAVRRIRTENVEPLAQAWRQAALETLSVARAPEADGLA